MTCGHARHRPALGSGGLLVDTWTIRKVDPDVEHEWILGIADKAAPAVKAAFLEALRRLRGTAKDAELHDALARGDIQAAMRALGVEERLPAELRPGLTKPLEDAFITTGRATPEKTIGVRVGMRFDLSNPHTAQFLRNYDLGLIRQVSQETRDGIRQVIIDAFRYGGHPYEQARAIRASIGLTETQAAHVGTFRRLLESNDRRALARELRDRRFDRSVRRAVAEDHTPDPEHVDRMVARYRDRFINMRAETIARTETIRASNAAQTLAWRQAVTNGLLDGTVLRRHWLVTPDDRLCPYCEDTPELNSGGIALDDYFQTPLGLVPYPPLHPNCFPGDTLVAARSRITGYSRRWFDGNLAVIRTASGNEFSTTVNHPILTRRGWVGAGFLQEGDDLIGGAFREGFGFGDAHDENVPATIHEIAESLGRSREIVARPVPVSAEHFHGDGEGSKVAIIGSDRLLWDNGNAAAFQQFLQLALSVPDVASAAALNAACHIYFNLFSFFRSACRIMGGSDLMLAGALPHFLPFHTLGGASSPYQNPQAVQRASDGGSADDILASELIGGSAGKVLPDKIVSVWRRPFSGHVYNLETEDGWYVAEGVIAHNCRCTTFIRPTGKVAEE